MDQLRALSADEHTARCAALFPGGGLLSIRNNELLRKNNLLELQVTDLAAKESLRKEKIEFERNVCPNCYPAFFSNP